MGAWKRREERVGDILLKLVLSATLEIGFIARGKGGEGLLPKKREYRL